MAKDERISRRRVLGFCVVSVLSAICAYYVGEPLRTSDRPSEYIGLIFSILAASIFAVVSIISDPGMLMSGSWRKAWVSSKAIQLRLQRLNLLFLWYLVTLGLLVFTEIIESEKWASMYFVHHIFAFFAVFGFIVSMLIPFELASIQRERLEQEIQHRRKPSDAS